MNRLGFNLEKEYFSYALDRGGFLLLLDGYDEMSPENRSHFFEEIDVLCDKYPGNYVIVSSRYLEELFGWQRFSIYETQPLSLDKAVELVKKTEYEKEIKEKFITSLVEELYESNQSFASNPLLLNIMLLTFVDFATIPEKKHIFYANAYNTLCQKHDATKNGYSRELKCKLSSDDFEKVFSEFCFITYLGTESEFSKQELIACLETIHIESIQFDPTLFIQDLIESVCLMYVDGTQYVFSHRSFQEYFTAVYLLSMNDSDQKTAICFLLDNMRNEATSDSVFEMLWDMNQNRFEQNCIIPILEEVYSGLYYDSLSVTYKKLFPHFVKEILIGNIVEQIVQLKEKVEYLQGCELIGYSKTKNLLCVSFNNNKRPHFLCFIASHAKLDERPYISNKEKLPVKYLARVFSSKEVINDPTLWAHITCYSNIHDMIMVPFEVLINAKNKQEEKNQNAVAMYEAFRNKTKKLPHSSV